VLGNVPEGGFIQRFYLINESLYRGLSGTDRSLFGTGSPGGNLLAVSDSIEVMRRLLDDIIQQNQTLIVTRVVANDQRAAEALQFAVVLTLGSVVITVLLAFLLARMITNPVRVLQAGVYRVAQGSFRPLRITSHDELADLTRAFNDMGEKLRRANEQRAEMMQRIVHELRTPLQSLHSVHYLLSEQIAGPLNEQQQKYVDMLRVNAERITDFTNQFLDLAKFEAGRMQFRQEPTRVPALVEKAVENARVHAEAHQITIALRAQDDLPELRVDPEKISQVVSNLLSNAVKYTPDGGQVEVAVEKGERGVRILVKDSGAGIDPEDVPHLFTKFYQAKNAGKARTKGTGIGLALVKAIVDGHGGTLRVESEVGKGSTFGVELPVSAGAEAKKTVDPVTS
jgi:signal transduction histidine kinase